MPGQHKHSPYRVRLPEAVRERLERRLARTGEAANKVIADAVREKLDREDRVENSADSPGDPIAYARAHITSPEALALLNEVERGRERRQKSAGEPPFTPTR